MNVHGLSTNFDEIFLNIPSHFDWTIIDFVELSVTISSKRNESLLAFPGYIHRYFLSFDEIVMDISTEPIIIQ